jgi:hypothetical protein
MNSASNADVWAMPLYRFYLLTAEGHIELRREADSDREACAIAAAAEIIGRHSAIEVWDEKRRVARRTAEDIDLSRGQNARMAKITRQR